MTAAVLAHGRGKDRRYLVEVNRSGKLVVSEHEGQAFHFPTYDEALRAGDLIKVIRESKDWRVVLAKDRCNRLR